MIRLALTALLLIAPAAAAETGRAWEDRLLASGQVPGECARAIAEFFTPLAGPLVGEPLERVPARADGIFARLGATGGIPFWGPRDALQRMRARFEAEGQGWVPTPDPVSFNRGYALWSPAPGRELLVIDHMRSPISAATSLWELVGKRVVLRAQFPAEIVRLEERDDAILVHTTDTFHAVALSWDKRGGALVGHCLVRMDGAASLPEPLAPPTAPLVVTRLVRPAPLSMLPPSESDNVALASLRRGEPVVVLAVSPAGVFVLARWRDRSPLTSLFRARQDRLWQVGWLATEALALP